MTTEIDLLTFLKQEIRDNLMGDHVKKPLDEYVSRLVQSWQISQPLHLRHLAIVRDTLLKGKTQIYIYYTYENFKKLVEAGTGYWEAVTSIPSEVTKGKNFAASLDAKPDVDEYGFPKLEENQFQGQHNDATIHECMSALNVDPVHVASCDPVLKKKADGSYGKYYNDRPPLAFINIDLGLWYTSHQQYSVPVGEDYNPGKAASTHSQPASIGARARETQNVALSTLSGAVSTKKHLVGPQNKVSSKPRAALANGGTPGQRRQSIRNPGSKARGRPRKYPKTGIPANFNTMTPDEVDHLFQSQEMFEKYEIVKLEKEIVRRVEDGEDAVKIAYEALAACDDSRKQKGELPLPTASRVQVLHKFAGGPAPVPNPAKAKAKGPNLKDTRYRPSMAAHTHFVLFLQKQGPPKPKSRDPGGRSLVNPSRKRKDGRGVSKRDSKIYLPSIAAHSWPYIRPPSLNMEIPADVLENKTRRKSGYPVKTKEPLGAHSSSFLPQGTFSKISTTQKRKFNADTSSRNDVDVSTPLEYRYLPSISAHSGSFLPPDASYTAGAGKKRRRTSNMLSQHDEHDTTRSPPPTAAPKTNCVPAQNLSLGTSNLQTATDKEGMYPGWEKFMSKYYQQQLQTITRSNGSVSIGKTISRRKRPCEPRDFRPAHFKLAIFKFAWLGELAWFAEKTTTASEQVSRLGSRAQTPITKFAEPATVPIPQSTSEGLSEPSNSTSLPPPDTSTKLSPPISSYESPYSDTVGTKRKRTTSSQPTRGVAPFDPFCASPHNRQSSQNAKSAEPVGKPSTLPEVAVSSPAVDQIHDYSMNESEAPAPTPEIQLDLNESSELTPNATVPNNSEPTESAVGTDELVPPSQSPAPEVSVPSNKHSVNKISRRGGSVALLRRNIIMEIVEKCEGVFPSRREMSVPFAAEWKRRGQEGTPEPKTISNAVDALIKENKLRQITFSAATKQGITVIKHMLILPTIDTTDPKVKEIQTSMAAYHPRYFVPLAVLPPQDSQSTEARGNKGNDEEASDKTTEETVQDSSALEAPILRRPYRSQKMMDGKDRAALARLKELKEQDQQESGHADGNETSTESIVPGASIDATHTTSRRGKRILPKNPSERPGGKRSQKRVERLVSIKKPIPSRTTSLPTMPVNVVGGPISLTWLPSNYAFSDFNFEEHRPTVLMAAAGNDLHIGTPQAPTRLNTTAKAKRRIQRIAENAARIERKQPLAKSTMPSLLHTDPSPAQMESPYAPVRPPSPPRHTPIFSIPKINTAVPRDQPFPYNQRNAGEMVLDRIAWPEDDLEQPNSGPEEIRQLQQISKSSQRESLSTTASPSPESPVSGVTGWPVYAHAVDFVVPNKRALLVGFMDPIHFFNRATGTFSVSFSGLRPPRRVLGRRGTGSEPYSARLKAVQPYKSRRWNTWSSSLHGLQKTERMQFDEEVDHLLMKELDVDESKNIVLMGWPFVNHVFSHPHETAQNAEASMEAAKQVSVRFEDGRLISKRFPKVNASRPRIGKSLFSTGNRGIDRTAAESQTPLKRRRLTSVLELGTHDEASEQVDLDHENRPTKRRRVRGPRDAKSLGENGEERLLTAVMVIRALTGGIDKRIDWVLVAKVFEPTYTQMFVHSRWNITLQKYKLVLPKMESEFQSIFARAYEEGTVPALDYDNLESYDWKWLIEWTMANIDTPTRSLPELPVERSEFDTLYRLDETYNNEINECYEIDGTSSLARRTKIMHRDPYVLPLARERRKDRPKEAEDFITVKSWIRANIVTPESTYDSSAARARFSNFPERMIEDALKQLLHDRVLTVENKGRLIPGRNYDVSDFLVSRLKKNLQPTHFHRAAAYKQQLDHDFEEKGFASYSSAVEDGDMLVIINLQAHQRITVVPIDVPMNKWGQTDGSYETRQMDKRRLNFSIELRPTPNYVYGNPISPLPAPPSGHLQEPMAKIPLWYDIQNSLVPVMWEMALAAVVAVLAVRPGVGASEMEKAMRPALEAWELQEILKWLVDAKAAKRVGQGFCVEDEWWWLALGEGESGEGCLGEGAGDGTRRVVAKDKGKGKERAEGDGDDFQDVTTMDLS